RTFRKGSGRALGTSSILGTPIAPRLTSGSPTTWGANSFFDRSGPLPCPFPAARPICPAETFNRPATHPEERIHDPPPPFRPPRAHLGRPRRNPPGRPHGGPGGHPRPQAPGRRLLGPHQHTAPRAAARPPVGPQRSHLHRGDPGGLRAAPGTPP